jgi:hypothetical protein
MHSALIIRLQQSPTLAAIKQILRLTKTLPPNFCTLSQNFYLRRLKENTGELKQYISAPAS